MRERGSVCEREGGCVCVVILCQQPLVKHFLKKVKSEKMFFFSFPNFFPIRKAVH
jgi:hypothetical protein